MIWLFRKAPVLTRQVVGTVARFANKSASDMEFACLFTLCGHPEVFHLSVVHHLDEEILGRHTQLTKPGDVVAFEYDGKRVLEETFLNRTIAAEQLTGATQYS